MELTLDQALQKGMEAHKAGQIQKADRLYTAILKAQPKHPDANHNMGVLAVGVGKAQEALPFFKTALEANPNTTQFWLSYIDALIKLERLADAKAVLDQAKDKGAKGEAFDQFEQRLNVSIKKPALAVSRAVGAVKAPRSETTGKTSKIQNPPQEQLQHLINIYKNGQLQKALGQADSLLQQFPSSIILYNIKGGCYAGLGQFESAEKSYQKAIKLKPGDAGSYTNFGNFLQLQGNLEEAIKAYNKALIMAPNIAETNYNMGNALGSLGKLEGALKSYNKAISIKPDYMAAYNNMGNILKKQGKRDEAIEAFSKVLEIKPDYAEAYNNMGNVLQDQGKLEEAIRAYEKALEIKPDYAEASYNIALLLHNSLQYEKAAMLFKKDPSSKSQTYLLKCLYEQNQQTSFYKQLDYLVNRGENNAVIGSFISRSEIRYGIKKINPFCNDPLKYALKIDLSKQCDFQNIFVKGTIGILNDAAVQNRPQDLLTNGIQTSGNVFNQIGPFRDEIQDIIRKQIEQYRMQFKNSSEGLITSWPVKYDLDGWVVKMKNGGAIKPHMHEEGWLSGSIYINVPPKLNKDSGNLVVCLDDNLDNYQNMKSIDVVTGSLCLFPSSLLHYTIPFEGDDDRIVLAFDMRPK